MQRLTRELERILERGLAAATLLRKLGQRLQVLTRVARELREQLSFHVPHHEHRERRDRVLLEKVTHKGNRDVDFDGQPIGPHIGVVF